MRKILYLLPLLLILCLMACGTSGRQARAKKINSELKKDPLTPEQRRKYDYYFLEAVRMKQKGDYDAAYALFKHCLDIYPSSAATLYEMSYFDMYLGLEEKGEQALKRAVRSEESNYWYKQTLANFYEGKRDLPKAIAVYEDMADQFPSRIEPVLSLIGLYGQTNSYSEEIRMLNRLEELDGKSEQISMEKFRMYLALEKMDSAYAEIESLAREYPYDYRYQTILGNVYLENGREKEAYDVYQRILKEEPGYGPVLIAMATYYQKTGQDSLYRLQVDSVLLSYNVESDTKLNIMRQMIVESEQGSRDSLFILDKFRQVLERPQPNADMAMLCAQYLVTKKMEKESVPVLNQVLELDPENKPARLQLMSYAIRDERLDDVIEIAKPALIYTPDALEFYYYIGLAYYQKKEMDEALDVFIRGTKQITDQTDKGVASDFYSIMGDIYHSKGLSEKSYAAYDSALVYNPNNVGAMNNYAYFLSVERKHLDKAEEMSYRTVKAEPDNDTFLDTYAWILFEKGKYTEARIYIEQALQNGGDSSRVIVEHCGDIYYKLGDVDKAVEYWKKADSMEISEADGSTPPTEQEIRRLKKKISLRKYIE
ncbi:tetratricopeptide repeat protein [uncultured Bacteroides sp.]|uniref:tetratricopeptide repeat protein n=1 Tax=uncultured Bacteroides sp. TaxID=162156 RepID=UPI00262F93EC|nr:tetratricopeptide repeat protein [uncultured Bacteroides sp.]